MARYRSDSNDSNDGDDGGDNKFYSEHNNAFMRAPAQSQTTLIFLLIVIRQEAHVTI